MSGIHQEILINPSLALAIEDAIMFGRHEELAAVLADLEDDEDFPLDLRHDLESLTYFRAHYGPGTLLSPMDRKKVALMDSAFGMELLNRLRPTGDAASIQRA